MVTSTILPLPQLVLAPCYQLFANCSIITDTKLKKNRDNPPDREDPLTPIKHVNTRLIGECISAIIKLWVYVIDVAKSSVENKCVGVQNIVVSLGLNLSGKKEHGKPETLTTVNTVELEMAVIDLLPIQLNTVKVSA